MKAFSFRGEACRAVGIEQFQIYGTILMHIAYRGSTSHSLARALRRGLLPPPGHFNSHDEFFWGGMPLFSTLAKPGVCIINKFDLCRDYSLVYQLGK